MLCFLCNWDLRDWLCLRWKAVERAHRRCFSVSPSVKAYCDDHGVSDPKDYKIGSVRCHRTAVSLELFLLRQATKTIIRQWSSSSQSLFSHLLQIEKRFDISPASIRAEHGSSIQVRDDENEIVGGGTFGWTPGGETKTVQPTLTVREYHGAVSWSRHSFDP